MNLNPFSDSTESNTHQKEQEIWEKEEEDCEKNSFNSGCNARTCDRGTNHTGASHTTSILSTGKQHPHE